MFNVYKITDAGSKPDSHDLVGLLIVETGEGFFLVDPDQKNEAPRILSNALFTIKQPPIGEFNMHFKELHWTININASSPGELNGHWTNKKHPRPSPPEEEDNWTAKGTGSGAGAGDDDEARAASTSY